MIRKPPQTVERIFSAAAYKTALSAIPDRDIFSDQDYNSRDASIDRDYITRMELNILGQGILIAKNQVFEVMNEAVGMGDQQDVFQAISQGRENIARDSTIARGRKNVALRFLYLVEAEIANDPGI